MSKHGKESCWLASWDSEYSSESGPLVARLFWLSFGMTAMLAWWSMGRQVHALIGTQGLVPFQPVYDSYQQVGAPSFFRAPTVFLFAYSDKLLTLGVIVGGLLCLLMMVGVYERIASFLMALLYLSYAVSCQNFCGFQWDSLLIECGVLAAFLPRDRRSPWAHWMFRILCFKLYVESGVAKWLSGLGDWHDGSAMQYYFETAPLPTWLGWAAHQLPHGWLQVSSWIVVGGELLVPCLIFAPKVYRRGAFWVVTSFQVVNVATANYGFFCWLACSLHWFLLTDDDVRSVMRWEPLGQLVECWEHWRRRFLGRAKVRLFETSSTWKRWKTWGMVGVVVVYSLLSVREGWSHFAREDRRKVWVRWSRIWRPFRVVNNYHLFASVTRKRVEPTFEVRVGGMWKTVHFQYKPGDPKRMPGWVAPFQPRMDFQMWFVGLNYRRPPAFVGTLINRLCYRPELVQFWFRTPLPLRAEAVRLVAIRYRMASWKENREQGIYWKQQWLGVVRTQMCQGN
jgi:lipase maturation factor 1